MLILAREPGQAIRVRVGGVSVWITLLDLDGRHARLGIEAPPERAEVDREEMLSDGERRGPCAKVGFASEEDAADAVASLRFKGKAGEVGPCVLRPYLCTACLCWHIGHARRPRSGGRRRRRSAG